MKLRKSYLRKLIQEELKHLLLEFDLVDDETQAIEGEPSETDAGHFDYDKGEDEVFEEGEDEHGSYVWDKVVKKSEDAMKRKKKKRSSDWMPDHIRGKTRNPKTGKDEPYQEGLRRRSKRQKRKRR